MKQSLKFEIRKLIKVGNSYAVCIPKEYFCQLNLIPHDKIAIVLNSSSISLTKFIFKEQK